MGRWAVETHSGKSSTPGPVFTPASVWAAIPEKDNLGSFNYKSLISHGVYGVPKVIPLVCSLESGAVKVHGG